MILDFATKPTERVIQKRRTRDHKRSKEEPSAGKSSFKTKSQINQTVIYGGGGISIHIEKISGQVGPTARPKRSLCIIWGEMSMGGLWLNLKVCFCIV